MDWINLGHLRDKGQAIQDTVVTEFHREQEVFLVDELSVFEEGICPMGVSMCVGR